jgi:hypothetical protein
MATTQQILEFIDFCESILGPDHPHPTLVAPCANLCRCIEAVTHKPNDTIPAETDTSEVPVAPAPKQRRRRKSLHAVEINPGALLALQGEARAFLSAIAPTSARIRRPEILTELTNALQFGELITFFAKQAWPRLAPLIQSIPMT